MVPTPVDVNPGEVRVYVGILDEQGVGRVGFVDLDEHDPRRVLRVAPEPVLDIGEPGTFDDNGVLPSSVVPHQGKLFLYYNGFQLGVKVRYWIFTGLAVSSDGGQSFVRVSRAPVLDRTDAEAMFRAAPFVTQDGGVWRIWYPAGDSWVRVKDKDVPVVRIAYAESPDGVSWPDEGRICIDFKDDDEHGIGRPWIFRDDGMYKMLYSIRVKSRPGESFLGYAESSDGIDWIRRDDEVGLAATPGSWDASMMRYGVVHRFGDRTVMLYNGDNFGEAGFGYATLQA
jgi:predicted GH43/DUF377 family glycosyl hydrolase